MKIIYFLLSLCSALHISPNNLPIRKQFDIFETSKDDLLKGIDQRDNIDDGPSIEHLLYIHEKHRLYLRLCSPSLSIIEKEKLANEFLEINSTLGTCLQNGGLLDDWNFDTF